MDPFVCVDYDVVNDISFFFKKINERSLYLMGIYDSYDDEGINALNLSVEYFHPQITLDDRMCYIAKHIVFADTSYHNIICNTIISHFYGARGIHQVITKEKNPELAIVDFERILKDNSYRIKLRKNLELAKEMNIPIYGSTELRTSLFDSANSFVSKKYSIERNSHPGNIMEWVAGFIERGITTKMKNVNSLKEMYGIISSIEGIGQYYGYHCSTSNSVNPNININHDERFCVPGPGARKTLDMLFKGITKKQFDYGDRVIWFRENQVKLIGKLYLHESTHNIVVNGRKIFKDEQDELKTYGCEVGLCQYGIYDRLKNNDNLVSRRKVARLEEKTMDNFFNITR